MAKTLDLEQKCAVMRKMLIEHAANHPGFHLGPALGLIEVATAFAEVFRFDEEQIIFDIGHQRYPFEMLEKLQNGEALTLPPPEKTYRFFRHPAFAGLSVASACGVVIENPQVKPIIFIGDGAFNAGEVYEGLNKLASLPNINCLILYNDNGMSINRNVGYLCDGEKMEKFVSSFDIDYIGPIDGHALPDLITIFQKLKEKKGKIFLHIKTLKGKGYGHAEKNPLAFHQPFTKFDLKTGEMTETDDHSIQNFFFYLPKLDEILTAYGESDSNFRILSPATPPLLRFEKTFPERYVDFGIAEQSCMTAATAIALQGKKAVNIMFSTFLSRCYSQLFDMCLAKANVLNIVFYSGLTPFGPYQQANHIMGALKSIPNLKVVYPLNFRAFQATLKTLLTEDGPSLLLVPKENPFIFNEVTLNQDSSASILQSGMLATVIPIGGFFEAAAQILEKKPAAEVLYLKSLKPIDYSFIKKSVQKTGRVFIVEDGYLASSLSSDIILKLHDDKVAFQSKVLSVQEKFIFSKHYNDSCNQAGLDSNSIVTSFLDFIEDDSP
jgi:1-deoxy-D-xylulose-5-phosphate synthase